MFDEAALVVLAQIAVLAPVLLALPAALAMARHAHPGRAVTVMFVATVLTSVLAEVVPPDVANAQFPGTGVILGAVVTSGFAVFRLSRSEDPAVRRRRPG